MKKIKILNEILTCIALLMCIFCMFKSLLQNRYDLNNDGKVDSADMYCLRQYLIQKEGCD